MSLDNRDAEDWSSNIDSEEAVDYQKNSLSRQGVEDTWTTYEKTTGHADMAGELFEVKMAALLYLRGLTLSQQFWLTSNMTSAGVFDDVVFVLDDADIANRKALCLQLKHKSSNPRDPMPSESRKKSIQGQQLISVSGPFGLIKYLNSYNDLKENINNRKDLRFLGPFESIDFVIFTNAGISNGLVQDLIEVDVGDLYNTGGKVYKINPKGKISSGLREFFIYKQFLKDLKRDAHKPHDEPQGEFIRQRMKSSNSWTNNEIKLQLNDLNERPCLNTVDKLLAWKALKFGTDENILDSFFDQLLICTEQVNESDLENLIKEEVTNVCKFITNEEVNLVFDELIKNFTEWWKYGNEVLNMNSTLWTDVVYSLVTEFSRSRIETLESSGVNFVEEIKELLKCPIKEAEMLVVYSHGELTTLTAKKVLDILKPKELSVHSTIFVDLGHFSKGKEKVLEMWKSRWFEYLIIECSQDLPDIEISKLAQEVFDTSRKFTKKVVLVSAKNHALSRAMRCLNPHIEELQDRCYWNDLEPTTQTYLRNKNVNFQGKLIMFGTLLGNNEHLTSKLDGEVINLILSEELTIGKKLKSKSKLYIPRKFTTSDKFIHYLTDVPEKVVCITGEPGIGKTSMINELATVTKNKNPTLWIACLNLFDCCDYLENLNLLDVNDKKSIEFVKVFATHSGTAFEGELFYHFMRSGQMMVLLDGVDEVSPHYDDKVLSILINLRDTNLRALWVTSRLGMKETIESKMKVASKKISYFSKEEQANLLKEFWKLRRPDKKEDDFDKFISAFCKLTSKSFIDKDLINGIPQLTIMLAETFEKDLLNSNLDLGKWQPRSLDLLQLYNEFVKKKHKTYFKMNKSEREKNFQIFVNNHMNAAVWSLFPNDEYADLKIPHKKLVKSELEKFCNEIKEGREKTGIIDGFNSAINRPRFIHRTFCEYFVALWLFYNFRNNVDFLAKRMFDPSFKIVTILLNQLFTTGHPLHTCALNRDLVGIENLLKTSPHQVDHVDEGGRTVLHLVALLWGQDHHAVYNDIARTLLNHGACVTFTDKVMTLRPLEIADRAMAWSIAGMILQHDGEPSDLRMTKINMNKEVFELFLDFLRQPDNNYGELIIAAVKHNEQRLVQYLIEDCQADVNWRGEDDVTLMHWAAYGGHIPLMTYLYKNGASYLSFDKNKNLPIHYAANHGGKNAVTFLIKKGSMVNAVNSSLETPLLIAAGSTDADLEVVQSLVQDGANINACNSDELSALYLSVEAGKLDTVKYLMQIVDLNKFGQAAYECALQKRDTPIIDYLYRRVEIRTYLPKNILSIKEALKFGVQIVIGILLLSCLCFLFKHVFNFLKIDTNPWLYEKLPGNTEEVMNLYKTNHNNTSCTVGGDTNLPGVECISNERKDINSKSGINLTYFYFWFIDKQLSISTDVMWKCVSDAAILNGIAIYFKLTKLLNCIGIIIWSLGLFFCKFSLNGIFILICGYILTSLLFVTESLADDFNRDMARYLPFFLNLTSLVIWITSLSYTSDYFLGFLCSLVGGIQILSGTLWRRKIPTGAKYYQLFLVCHCIGLICSLYFVWSRSSTWPTWLLFLSWLLLASLTAGILVVANCEHLFPQSLPGQMKTIIKHRLSWLMLFVPLLAFIGVNNAFWAVEMEWTRWFVILILPLPVFTVFFEWSRRQMYISTGKI